MKRVPQSCVISRDNVRNGVIVTLGDRAPWFYPAASLHARTSSLDEEVPSENDLQISSIDRMDDGSLIIEFSDGSVAIYTVAELVKLRPDRQIPINDQLH